ncbi:hypothetical protein ACLOJK_010973 [Asimina triloba]
MMGYDTFARSCSHKIRSHSLKSPIPMAKANVAQLRAQMDKSKADERLESLRQEIEFCGEEKEILSAVRAMANGLKQPKEELYAALRESSRVKREMGLLGEGKEDCGVGEATEASFVCRSIGRDGYCCSHDLPELCKAEETMKG